MSYTQEFLQELIDSEFKEPYTDHERNIVSERIERKFKDKLYKAVIKAGKDKGLKLNKLDEISVSHEGITTGEIIIKIFKAGV